MNPNDNIPAPNTTPDPGSLNFISANPETGETIIYEVPKTNPETAPEKLINEIPTPQPETQPQENKQTTQPIAPTVAPVEPPKVVDTTKNMTKLHHLEHTLDKLTSIADDEEEKFITEVESAHGHK